MEEYSTLELILMELPFPMLYAVNEGWYCWYSVWDFQTATSDMQIEPTPQASTPLIAAQEAYERWVEDGRPEPGSYSLPQ